MLWGLWLRDWSRLARSLLTCLFFFQLVQMVFLPLEAAGGAEKRLAKERIMDSMGLDGREGIVGYSIEWGAAVKLLNCYKIIFLSLVLSSKPPVSCPALQQDTQGSLPCYHPAKFPFPGDPTYHSFLNCLPICCFSSGPQSQQAFPTNIEVTHTRNSGRLPTDFFISLCSPRYNPVVWYPAL